MIREFSGYVKTAKNYWRSSKGRFDILDYLKAATIIFVASVLVIALVFMLAEG